MSISGALSNALSGLTANARAAQVTASNLSNALTPGYGRRSLDLATRGIGSHGGVQVMGLNRLVDSATLSDRRLASAHQSNAQTVSEFHMQLEALIGLPGEAGALGTRLTNFEDALIAAGSRPDLSDRLDAVGHHAESLATKFRTMSGAIQDMRVDADSQIDRMVSKLNASLSNIAELNSQISRLYNTPEDILTLQDQRQKLIDEVAEIVPVRIISRDRGVLGLYTTGGGILLDGPAPELSFTRTPTISPHMTYAGNLLGGITINGKPVDLDADSGPFSGGALAAQISIRDTLAPEAQAQVDALAMEVIDRFQSTTLDTTIAATDPALFTDAGSRFSSLNELGIAGRITLNTLVSSTGSGETWRIRDGLGTAVTGDPGNASLINSMRQILATNRSPASVTLSSESGGVGDLINSVLSHQGLQKTIADQELGFRAAQLAALQEKEHAQGVDSDQELQTLLLVEQSYAANARMIETVDDLIQTLLRL